MNYPKPPGTPHGPPQPGEQVNDTLEEVISHAKTVGRGLLDFLLSDTEKDVRAGAAFLNRIRPERVEGRAQATIPTMPNNVVDEDDCVMIVEENTAQPCPFCRGKAVVTMNRATGLRRSVPCPTCKAPAKPGKHIPPALGK